MEKIDNQDEMKLMKEVIVNLKESDFKELTEDCGRNIMVLTDEQAKAFMDEPRGSEVMFVVRGAIKGHGGDSYPHAIGEEDKSRRKCVEIYLFDAAAVHGKKYGKEKFQKMAATGLRRYYKGK